MVGRVGKSDIRNKADPNPDKFIMESQQEMCSTSNITDLEMDTKPMPFSWAFPDGEDKNTESAPTFMKNMGPQNHETEDLRVKIDKRRESGRNNRDSERHCEKSNPEKSYEARTPRSERDLRNRIGNRRGQLEHREQHSSGSKYTRSPNGLLSPLRSPHASTKTYSVMDMDNSRSHRYTKKSSGQERRGKRTFDDRNSSRSDDQGTSDGVCDTPRHQTCLSETDEEGTPILWKPSPKGPRKSWSRRRLQLPSSENEDSDNDSEETRGLPTILEEGIQELSIESASYSSNSSIGSYIAKARQKEKDPARLARREKDILYGKNTEAYKLYLSEVPRETRSKDTRVHPRTPQKQRKCSRRSWDAQVRIWKKRLHAWASEPSKRNLEQDKEMTIDDLDMDGEMTTDSLPLDEDDSFLEELELNLSEANLDL